MSIVVFVVAVGFLREVKKRALKKTPVFDTFEQTTFPLPKGAIPEGGTFTPSDVTKQLYVHEGARNMFDESVKKSVREEKVDRMMKKIKAEFKLPSIALIVDNLGLSWDFNLTKLESNVKIVLDEGFYKSFKHRDWCP